MAEDTKDIEIKALPWNEHIRLRHGMYIGDVNNPNVIFREIVDNFTDEAYACEYCNKGFIHNDFNGYHVVFDNGRGIPHIIQLILQHHQDKSEPQRATDPYKLFSCPSVETKKINLTIIIAGSTR